MTQFHYKIGKRYVQFGDPTKIPSDKKNRTQQMLININVVKYLIIKSAHLEIRAIKKTFY